MVVVDGFELPEEPRALRPGSESGGERACRGELRVGVGLVTLAVVPAGRRQTDDSTEVDPGCLAAHDRDTVREGSALGGQEGERGADRNAVEADSTVTGVRRVGRRPRNADRRRGGRAGDLAE